MFPFFLSHLEKCSRFNLLFTKRNWCSVTWDVY